LAAALSLARGGLPAAVIAAHLGMAAWAGGGPESASESEQEQALFRGMPDDEGRLEVFGFCGSCHSIDLVLQQGLPRAAWEQVLVEMVRDQEMAPLQTDVRMKVLGYLEEHYGPDRKARTQTGPSEPVLPASNAPARSGQEDPAG